VDGLVASVDGKTIIRDTVEGAVADARDLGLRLGDRLLERGADGILQEIYGGA
jgi:hydroxymethylbilane synthase